jgi:Rieske Fe-S protein
MNERRRFLTVLGAAAVTAAACGDEEHTSSTLAPFTTTSGGGTRPDPMFPAGFIVLEQAADLPVGSVVQVLGHVLFLGRDASGFYAMTGRCTHENCSMVDHLSVDGVECMCHGSAFDLHGLVVNGPAVNPLPHYHLEFDEWGNVGIDTSQVVALDFRAQPV